MPAKNQAPKIQIGWTTVTYRSVLMMILMVVGVIGLAMYVTFPDFSKKYAGKAWNFATGKLANVGKGKTDGGGQQQASFTLIEGTVKVKKANSNTWVTADYQLPLEKGDVIQTSSEGLAKVVFPDGTNYNVKQDSLIVIEENSANEQQTNVAVQLTTGTVDLSTGTYTPGSKSQVIVGGATANFAKDTSAMVRNDPKQDAHEILVKRGEGEVARGAETVKLKEYEQVSFKAESPKMVKEKQIAPPTLISPGNMLPIFLGDPKAPVQFTWTPVTSSVEYRLRISRNPYFSSTVYDRPVSTTDALVTGLGEGAFYWMVQSQDINGRTSIESERNRFTIIRKGPENVSILLELGPIVQHGHVLEIKGKTEASARVMVNGQEVPTVQADGSFIYFTPQLPNGENLITITAQNSHGGVKTLQKNVVIQ